MISIIRESMMGKAALGAGIASIGALLGHEHYKAAEEPTERSKIMRKRLKAAHLGLGAAALGLGAASTIPKKQKEETGKAGDVAGVIV